MTERQPDDRAYGIKIKIVNNLLLSRILDRSETVNAFCRDYNLSATDIGELVNMKAPAVNARGEWRVLVLKLSEILGYLPEEMFTEEQMQARLERNSAYLAITQQEASLLGSVSTPDTLAERRELVHRLIEAAGLNAKQAEVLRLRLEDWTLDEIGEKLKCTGSRIQQIEAKALLKLNRGDACFNYSPEQTPEQKSAATLHRIDLKRRAGMDTFEDERNLHRER